MRCFPDLDWCTAELAANTGIGALAVATTTFLALFANISPGMAALAITSAQTLVQSVYCACSAPWYQLRAVVD
mgnify:CR=1 FL=1